MRVPDPTNLQPSAPKPDADKPAKPQNLPVYPQPRVAPGAIETAGDRREDSKANLQRSPSNQQQHFNHQQAIEREKERRRREQKEKELLQRQKEERDKEQKLKEARDRELRQKLEKEKEQRLRDARDRELREKRDKQLQAAQPRAPAPHHHQAAPPHRPHHQLHPQHMHAQQQNLLLHQQHKKHPAPAPNEQRRKLEAAKKPLPAEAPRRDEDEELRRRAQKEQELEEKKRLREQERQKMLSDIKLKKMQLLAGRDKSPDPPLRSDPLPAKDFLEGLQHADPSNFRPQEFFQNVARLKDLRGSEAQIDRPASARPLPKGASASVANLAAARPLAEAGSPRQAKPAPVDKLRAEREASKQAKQLEAQSSDSSKPTEAGSRSRKLGPEPQSRGSERQIRAGRESSSQQSGEEQDFVFSKVPPRRNSSQERHLFEYSATTGMNEGPVFTETAHFAPELEDLIEGIKQASGRVDERFERETNEFFINDRPVVPTTNLDFITVGAGEQIKKQGPAIKVEEEDPEYHLSSFGQLEDLRMQIEKKIGPDFFSLYSKVKEAVLAADQLEDPENEELLDLLCEDPKAMLKMLEMPLNSAQLVKSVTMITKFVLKEQTVIESGKNDIKSQLM